MTIQYLEIRGHAHWFLGLRCIGYTNLEECSPKVLETIKTYDYERHTPSLKFDSGEVFLYINDIFISKVSLEKFED